jgi:beta-lactamase class A
MIDMTRRTAIFGVTLLLPQTALAQAGDAPWRKFKDLEAASFSRIGVAAIDTGSGTPLFWRESERFIMCSTFKLALVAAVLARADTGKEDLSRVVYYDRSDLLEGSPVTTRNVAAGMRIDGLCEAAIIYSDNTAANLLLASIGGPPGLTSWLRQLGDETTRLDRIEPALNVPDGDKDTTTPAAMLGTVKTILLGNGVSAASRKLLSGWLAANTTGGAMLRAGLPPGWAVGNKTGHWTSQDKSDGAANDLAVATPPGRKPILIVCYTMGGKGDDAARQAVLAQIGHIAADMFATPGQRPA